MVLSGTVGAHIEGMLRGSLSKDVRVVESVWRQDLVENPSWCLLRTQ
jgi:hypothetical protein